MENKDEILKKLYVEDIVWIIYLIIIGLSFLSNYFERKYILYDSEKYKNKYRIINITVFTLAVLIYIYFVYDNYKDVTSLKKDDSNNKIEFTYLAFAGTVLALISGLIFLYISIYDTNIETEIAFN